ncbi:MAG: 5-formyltetrahydrofolate cyclo-ligase [Oscillospiraceae bacterium]|jgi:5-formyltetrahydrofolate cyclo-ligase|nr:5-formyltetrahydrofolate cyclo-ligase [Oscillospiraceae bacterium]
MDKAALRRLVRTQRRQLPAEARAAADSACCTALGSCRSFRAAPLVLAYYPLPGEPNLLHILAESGKALAFPYSGTDSKGNPQLYFYPAESFTAFVPDPMGIPAPNPSVCRPCQPQDFTRGTLCLVPGMAYDTHGNRLGYGKGYYDRFLSTFPGKTIGVCYDSFLLPSIPTDPQDVAVQALLTQLRYIEIKG